MTRTWIVIPTFNSARTLPETLKSIMDQGESARQLGGVCLADDCSTDDTVAIATTTWTAEIPLRILRVDRNLGERENTNRAARTLKADADWFVILHSDDLAKPCWLELVLERIRTCDPRVASVCSSWDTRLPDGSVEVGEDEPRRPVEVVRGDPASVRGTLKSGCWWHVSGCAIRMEAFEEIGGFNRALPQAGDWEWLLRCLSRGWWVEYIPRTLITYRRHERSLSTGSLGTSRDILESLSIIQQYSRLLGFEELAALHWVRVRACGRRLVRALLEKDLRRVRLTSRAAAFAVTSAFRTLTSKVRAHPDGIR